MAVQIRSRERPLNATDHATLAQAQRDVDDIGRLRTSSELLGLAHRQRGHLLASRVRLEERGYIVRYAKTWASGTTTAAGRGYLASHVQPIKQGAGNVGKGGLATDGGTKFKGTLTDGPLLSLGGQNHKLGTIVRKGRHKGFMMRAVTLEEGRTCPASCALRPSCYGGGMPFAKRVEWKGEATGEAIAGVIARAPRTLVRLHTLGDFPSIPYARNVLAALHTAGSAAFGFTHWSPGSTLGYAIRKWAKENWNVFSIRTSYLAGSREPIPERSAVIISHPDQAKEHNAVVCPEQMGKVASCAECGFCWHSQRPVAFVLHEQLAKLKREAPAPDPLKVAA